MRRLLPALALFLGLIGLAPRASAQVTGRGQEFWGCWPRSHLSLETSAEIIVMSDEATTAEIDGAFAAGPAAVAPGSPWIVPLPDTLRMAAQRTVLSTGFRVRSLDPAKDIIVTLRVPRQAEASDDTARLLPVSELGTHYIATSYPAALPGEPSLYAVVATEDNTTVDAASPCLGTTDRVVLNRGQVWQVFCDWRSVPADVSGADISADKPVAVFGGSSDAFVPVNYLSGDFVVEQMAPVSSWGSKFFTCPLPKGPNAIAGAYDVIRIMPSAPGTLTVDDGTGPVATTMRAVGVPVDLTLKSSAKITSDVPIEVYQFACGNELTDIGDPFMAQVPALEHWGTGARAWIPAYYQVGNYLSVVTDNSALGSASLDGAPITGWQPLPGGSHSWALIPLGTLPGERVVTCGAPVGVLAFGFNDAYLPDPGLGETPGSHGTVVAHSNPPCTVLARADIPSSSCIGATLALRDAGSTVAGCAALEFRWLENGVEIPGCGFSPSGTCNAVFHGAADYTLEARCAALPVCIATATARVADDPPPPARILPNPAETCAGQPLDLTADAGFALYAWTSDVPDPGVTPRAGVSPTLTVTPEQDTTYTLTTLDARGCASTSNVLVTVTPDPLPPAMDASLRVVKSGASDTLLSWQDLPTPWRGYEVVCLDCAYRDWPLGCAGNKPDPATIQSSPTIAPAVAPGVQQQLHAGALDLGDLLFYKVRATSNCAGMPGPTCNPWPMQWVPCP